MKGLSSLLALCLLVALVLRPATPSPAPQVAGGWTTGATGVLGDVVLGPGQHVIDLATTGQPVLVQPLMGPGEPIGGATLEGTGTPHLRVTIPDDRPTGIYSGLVVEQSSNRPVGSIMVEVHPADSTGPGEDA